MTYTRFHIADDGSSDTCPIKLVLHRRRARAGPVTRRLAAHGVVPDDSAPAASASRPTSSRCRSSRRTARSTSRTSWRSATPRSTTGCGSRRSTNGGASFLASPVHGRQAGAVGRQPGRVRPASRTPRSGRRTRSRWRTARRPARSRYVYTNYIRGRGNGDIDVSLSHDGGATWSDPDPDQHRAERDPHANNQFFPWIAVDANGRFVAIWLDRRQDPNNHDIGTLEAGSTDDGADVDERRDQHSDVGSRPRVLHVGRLHRRLQRPRRERSGDLPGLDGRAEQLDRRDRHRRDRRLHRRRDRHLGTGEHGDRAARAPVPDARRRRSFRGYPLRAMRADTSFEPLLTERLRLRRSVPEDAEAISAYRNEPAVRRYQGWGDTGPDDVRATIEEMAGRAPGEPGGWVQLTVEDREHGAAGRRRRHQPGRPRSRRHQDRLHDRARVPGLRLRDRGGRRADRLRASTSSASTSCAPTRARRTRRRCAWRRRPA